MDDKPYEYRTIEGETYAIPNKFYWQNINKKKYEILLKRSRIPKFYWDVEFEDYKGNLSRDNVDKVKYMCQNINDPKFKDISLYLWGCDTGSQKTASACNFGKECIRQGLYVKFMLFGTFVNYLMKCQGFHTDSEYVNIIKELKQSDIIILDDAFDPSKSMLWKDINSRNLIISEIDIFFRELIYNNKRFVLTSNLSPQIIKENYGSFLYDLIDRNFISFQFLDSVIEVRKERMSENLWPTKDQFQEQKKIEE